MLITQSELYKALPVGNNLDFKTIQSSIDVVERKTLVDLLGHALLTEITTQYNSNTLTPENADLRTSYLINVISWEALYRSLNFIHTRIDSLGVVQNKATTTDSTDLDSLRNISEDIKNRALDYYNICKDFLECTFWR